MVLCLKNIELNKQIEVNQFTENDDCKKLLAPYYVVILLDGKAQITIDSITYHLDGQYVICTSPYQSIEWIDDNINSFSILNFHGDFYCIAYHKKEVACNGILFNNIYLPPYSQIPQTQFIEVLELMHKISHLANVQTSYDLAIIKSYLQTLLAISSKYKTLEYSELNNPGEVNHPFENFIALLDNNFIEHRNVNFYAKYYNLTPYTFSKQIKKYFGKTPTTLIQERMILEAQSFYI